MASVKHEIENSTGIMISAWEELRCVLNIILVQHDYTEFCKGKYKLLAETSMDKKDDLELRAHSAAVQ